MNRAARVSLDGTPVGVLTEARSWREPGCRLCFSYDPAWLEREDAVPLSAAVPLGPGARQTAAIDAFFENLLPEGCMLEAAAASRRLPAQDLYGLLLDFGRNCIGAVEVVPCGSPAASPAAPSSPVVPTRERQARERPAGRELLPEIHVGLRLADVRDLADDALSHTVLPGVHRKIPLELSSERRRARSAPGPGRYILKPQSAAPHLPENEFVTLRIAAAAGVDVVAFNLVPLGDSSLALLLRRFDRTETGRKLRVDDFCQLAGRRPCEKYDASAELCAQLVARHASEPLLEIARLFRRLVVAWWTGAEVHLKNLGLLTGPDGVARLAPAYGLRCMRLWDDEAGLALPVNGKREGLGRQDWLRFADACALRRPAAERVLREVSAALDPALDIVADSPLPDGGKRAYGALLRSRARALATAD